MDDQFIKTNTDEQEDTKESDNTTSEASDFKAEDNNNSSGSANPITPPQQKPKKNKKKLWLLILLALLVLGSAAAYWYFFMKEQAQNPSSSNQETEAQTELTKADTRLFFHIGKKLISYDTKTKEDEKVLTSSIPDGASILDFYAEGENWRAYYDLHDGADYTINYIEKDSTPKEVYKTQEFVMAAASAKSKTVAYTVVFDVSEGAAEEKTKNRHYVIQNDKTTLLLESAKYDVEKAASDADNPLYTIGDMTSDGKKAMMQLYTCFYCDGPSKATGMEIDIESKKTTLVYESEKSGNVKYDNEDSYLVTKSESIGMMGYSDDPWVEELLGIKKAGDEPKSLLSVSEKDWGNLRYSQKAEFLSPEIRTQNYVENGITSFGGIYETKGPSVSDAVKLTVEDFDGSKFAISNFGEIVNGCVGVATGDRDDPYGAIGNNKYQVGAVCKEGDKTKFYMVDELSVDSKDSVFEIISAL